MTTELATRFSVVGTDLCYLGQRDIAHSFVPAVGMVIHSPEFGPAGRQVVKVEAVLDDETIRVWLQNSEGSNDEIQALVSRYRANGWLIDTSGPDYPDNL